VCVAWKRRGKEGERRGGKRETPLSLIIRENSKEQTGNCDFEGSIIKTGIVLVERKKASEGNPQRSSVPNQSRKEKRRSAENKRGASRGVLVHGP
jgi:hypothetical protein